MSKPEIKVEIERNADDTLQINTYVDDNLIQISDIEYVVTKYVKELNKYKVKGFDTTSKQKYGVMLTYVFDVDVIEQNGEMEKVDYIDGAKYFI